MYSLRKFTSLSLTFSFIMMSYTGILLFIAPKGRVANWTNWELLGLDKTQYTNLHVTFMVLFLITMFFHLFLNWRPLIGYFKNKARTFSLFNKEFALALSLNLLFIVGTLLYWTPFEEFLDFEDDIKSSWEKVSTSKAPYGHAELSTIEEFAQKTQTDASNIVTQLRAKGLKEVSPLKTIEQIAKENAKSPAQLFEMISLSKTSSSLPQPKEGGGMGKLSLKEVCEQHAIAIEKAQSLLHTKGFDATPNHTLREIAEALHVSPLEVLELLKTNHP